jgi:hypothetical protein
MVSSLWQLLASQKRGYHKHHNMDGVSLWLIGFIVVGIIMNIIGWTDYYLHRR